MHELSRANTVLAEVLSRANGRRVRSVKIVLSMATGHVHGPEEFVELFAASASGTPAENAAVSAEYVHASYVCDACGFSEEGMHFTPIRCSKCASPDITTPPDFTILELVLED